MAGDPRAEGREASRLEAARQVVRGLGAAFKAVRLYSTVHTLTAQALQTARSGLEAYLAQYGPLTLSFPSGGIAFDFHPHPHEDEISAELARALRANAVRAVGFLPGVTAAEIGELLQILSLPVQRVQRGGGIGKLLRERGGQNLAVDDLAAAPVAPDAGAGVLELLRSAVAAASPEQFADGLERAAGGDVQRARGWLREVDHSVVTWAKSAQSAAWRTISLATLLVRTSWRADLCRMIVGAIDEPWAASIASQWPPEMINGLLAQADGNARGARQQVADALRSLHTSLSDVPLPADVSLSEAGAEQAGVELSAAAGAEQLRTHAVRRLLAAAAALDTERFEACLALVERETVAAVREDNLAMLLAMLTGVSALAAGLADVRGALAHASLQRMIALGGGDLVEKALAQPVTPEHPFSQAMQFAPAVAVRLLLEMVGADERLQVRREILGRLTALIGERMHLLADVLLDPRWHIARNAVIVLAASGRPEVVRYLRAALAHSDLRVRKEALQALAQLRTPQALEVLVEMLRRSEGDTRKASAQWLGVTGMPEAVSPLAAVLNEEPLHEQPEVKREIIRALGRIGTPEAAAALARVLGAGGVLHRRQVEELKQEAAQALQQLREGRR